MHSRGFVHRDLKHLNIFLSDTKDLPKVKIGDFGLTCRLGEDEMIVKRAGTIAFMAPEIVNDEPSDFKADVWSLGVILYALISSLVPFNGASKEETSDLITQAPVQFEATAWNTVSEDCKELIRGMLRKDQEKRLSIEEVLSHRWFQS